MNIDFSPLPESLTPIKVPVKKSILLFLGWLILLFIIALIGSAFNNNFIMEASLMTLVMSVFLGVVFGPIALLFFLYPKGLKFETEAGRYFSSFSYHNGWSYSPVNDERSIDNPYMPPSSKNQLFTRYPASTQWIIDATIYNTPAEIVGLSYIRDIASATHYITVIRIARQPYFKITKSKNVIVEQDEQYYYIYRNSTAVRQLEMKQLFDAIEFVQ